MKWNQLLELESSGRYDEAYKVLIYSKEKFNPSYVLFYLVGGRLCIRLAKFKEAEKFINKFFLMLSEENMSESNKSYLSAYAALVNSAVSYNLNYANKYDDFLKNEFLDLGNIKSQYKRLFPLPGKEVLENPESFLYT